MIFSNNNTWLYDNCNISCNGSTGNTISLHCLQVLQVGNYIFEILTFYLLAVRG